MHVHYYITDVISDGTIMKATDIIATGYFNVNHHSTKPNGCKQFQSSLSHLIGRIAVVARGGPDLLMG